MARERTNPQTDRGVANQRSGSRLRYRCSCGRILVGNAARASHEDAARRRGDESAHQYDGRA